MFDEFKEPDVNQIRDFLTNNMQNGADPYQLDSENYNSEQSWKVYFLPLFWWI